MIFKAQRWLLMLLASDDEGPQERSSKTVSLHELLQRPCRCKRVVCLQQFSGFEEQILAKRKHLQALSPHDRVALLMVRMLLLSPTLLHPKSFS